MDNVQETTASVVLKMTRDHTLDSAGIAAITHLLAGSVKDLKPEGVTVVDSQGNLLSGESGLSMSYGGRTVVRTEKRHGEDTAVTETLSRSTDGQNDPVPANALSYEDRRELVRLMDVYGKVTFSGDLRGVEAIFNFESETQKKRVLDMVRQERDGLPSGDEEPRRVHVIQIDPMAENRALVSALLPLGERYIAHSVSWAKIQGQWKVAMDLEEMMDTQKKVRAMGAEAYGRLQVKRQLESWETAQGSALVSLYEDAKRQAQFRVRAMQFAKLKALSMQGHVTETQNQEQLDQIRGKSPEAYRRDMIAQLRRALGPAEKYGKLEFRITRRSSASGRLPDEQVEAAEQRERDRFKNNGPLDTSSKSRQVPTRRQAAIWLPVRPQSGTSFPDAIIEEYQGLKYILVSNQVEEIMTADGSWGILAVSPQADGMGRRAIGLELDKRGGEKLRQITSHNINRAMAIVVDGQVLSAPTVKAAIGPHVLIAGQFTDQEVRDLMVSLQKGMRSKPAEIGSF
ncbi:MAG: hypothetical protein GY809_30700 [Planctomycetes bacterium]|nr:hypothetical protein [Planctomycetota bacterium]